MDLWLQALCFYCVTMVAPPAPRMSRAYGDIRYTEEPLGSARLLRLSTTDFIIDNDGWRQHRLRVFAESYADRACNGRYRLAPSRELIVIRPSYTKQFVYSCR